MGSSEKTSLRSSNSLNILIYVKKNLQISMSRYPSAHGHTPSYKSLGSGAGSSYPSALGSSVLDSGSSLGRDMDREMAAMKREMDRDFGTTRSSGLGSSSMVDPLKYSSTSLGLSLPLSRREENSSSSSSSAVDGGRPHHSSHTDSVSRTTRTGAAGIPHTSYSHNTSSFDSDRPYRNNVSSFSYNI